MILSQIDLRAAVRKGEIGFYPELEDDQWGEASIDLRLGFLVTKLERVDGLTVDVSKGLGPLGRSDFYKDKKLKATDEFGHRESVVLHPGEFILWMTYESIRVPKHMIAMVEGRSTYARVGLSMHQTAPWIQPGWDGPIILEIVNSGPLEIKLTPLVDRPCQITFFELKTGLPAETAYGAKASDTYQKQKHPLKPAKPKKK